MSHLFFHSWRTCSFILPHRIWCVIILLCIFPSYAKFYFQFISVISFGSWIWIKIYQYLGFAIFHFPLSHSPHSYQHFLFLCWILGLYTGEYEFQVSLDVLQLLCRDGLLGEARKPAYSASLYVLFFSLYKH